jgi:ABC-type phosphate transport system permease subunit
VLFALATVLLLLTIATNAAARVLLERLRRRGAGR